MDESTATLINTFRENAEKYGVSEKEIQFVSDLFPKFRMTLVFTFKQFEMFYEQWRPLFDGNSYLKSFFLYPKDRGLHIDGRTDRLHIKLVALSSTYYKPCFGPGFIGDLRKYYKTIKHNHGKLVVLSNDRIDDSDEYHSAGRGVFNTFGQKAGDLFIGGGRLYHEPSAQPMGELDDIYKHLSEYKTFRLKYDQFEQYILCKTGEPDYDADVREAHQTRKRWNGAVFKHVDADNLQRIIDDYITFDSEDTQVFVCHDGKWPVIKVRSIHPVTGGTLVTSENRDEFMTRDSDMIARDTDSIASDRVLTRSRKRKIL